MSELIERNGLQPCLDLCCGLGTQCGLLAGLGQRAVGLDLDFRMLQHAQTRHPLIPFLCADAVRVPLRSRSFRSIILSFSLHEKSPEIRRRMLHEARRLLDEDGRLILVDFDQPWNKPASRGERLTRMIERMAGAKHYRNGRQFLSQGGLTGFVNQHGLIILEGQSFSFSHTRLFLVKISSHDF